MAIICRLLIKQSVLGSFATPTHFYQHLPFVQWTSKTFGRLSVVTLRFICCPHLLEENTTSIAPVAKTLPMHASPEC